MRRLLCLAALITWGCHEGTSDLPEQLDPGADAEVDSAVPCEPGTVEACTLAGGCVGERGCPGGVRGPCLALPERCDGVDDDCDGAVDEAFAGLGGPCAAGVGVCETPGRVVCLDDGSAAECDARPGEGDDETCNGVDDDCDGMLDEDIESAPCETGQPGICAAGALACRDGASTCAPLAEPTAETCDGLDQDCDGVADEGDDGPLTVPCHDGPPETEGVGRCVSGARTCADGALGACEGSIGPADEQCDGFDDDCDGVVDEGLGDACQCLPGQERLCYPGPPDTQDVAACRGGVQACAADFQWGPCLGAVTPAEEVCDDIDNDCDGAIDDVAGVGEPCSVGVGACAVDGVRACILGAVACDATPGEPSDETCDGRDEDCDGAADEQDGGAPLEQPCYDGPAGTEGVGLCLPGVSQCAEGAFGACAGQVLPAPELCDGRDNDCDGTIGDIGGDGCDPAFCGNAIVDAGEECDDGNTAGGDGCSAECVVEPAFACAVEGFGVGVPDTLPMGVAPSWRTSDDGLTVTQSENADASTYSTTLPVGATYRAALRLAVDTDIDDDFVGWTVGAGDTPMTAPTGPYLLFSWKQGAQDFDPARRAAGLYAARVDGPVDAHDLWGSEGPNIERIAVGRRFGAVGWIDNREYLVELVGDADRLRVYIDGELEFDLAGPLPSGTLGFFTYSQQAFRAELVGPLTLEVCRPIEP